MIPLIYDQINKWSIADDFYVKLLNKIDVKEIADLGCGTGRLTTNIANENNNITGIDPDSVAIKYAKEKKSANFVKWIVGDSSNLKDSNYEAVIMTANVAQVFIEEENWDQTLNNVYNSLTHNGHFIFDVRNPLVKSWIEWENDETPDIAFHPITDEVLEIWTEYEGFKNNVYTFYETVKNKNTNEIIIKKQMQLIFRDYDEIMHSLFNIGFKQIKCYGDWKFEDATNTSKSFIFHAIK
ncbi:class I SAM-dependent methyltransferase [Macrococcus armenti]|uniref:class I SAM-dependent methyltransferase n=1 Tax=Macrococcus armenti TaxID=2875764 RepID=UPI001CCC01A6|nr:class I SAM-dependent methyltransferase [Macrococcus armenti]UBH21676.1 class I SAM-dependent methyltransferase [Macrococcus armenti]